MTADTGKKFEMLTEKLKGKKKKRQREECASFLAREQKALCISITFQDKMENNLNI